MEKIAFVMKLKPGNEAEYEKRHDEIWPVLYLMRFIGNIDGHEL